MRDRKLIARVGLYALFIAPIVYLSASPAYRPLNADEALVRVALTHLGQLIGDCRDRSPDELARLPVNMRAERLCPRARAPVRLRVEIDERIWVDETHAARGLAADGAVMVYHRMPIVAGSHRIRVLIADGSDADLFQHVREASVRLAPGSLLTIDFDRERREIAFR